MGEIGHLDTTELACAPVNVTKAPAHQLIAARRDDRANSGTNESLFFIWSVSPLIACTLNHQVRAASEASDCRRHARDHLEAREECSALFWGRLLGCAEEGAKDELQNRATGAVWLLQEQSNGAAFLSPEFLGCRLRLVNVPRGEHAKQCATDCRMAVPQNGVEETVRDWP
eukprot:3441013-Prymnesium_polylepis.2